jgi:hypothetical protein
VQGALGIRSLRDQYEPEEIPDLPRNVAAIGAGHYQSYAITTEVRSFLRAAPCWRQRQRQCLAACCGPHQLCCVHRTHASPPQGQLLSWGRNNEGQLGRALAHEEFGWSAVPAPVEALSRHHVRAPTRHCSSIACLPYMPVAM